MRRTIPLCIVFTLVGCGAAAAETIILKCVFKRDVPGEVTYVLNTDAPKEMSVIGGFGTHPAAASMTGPFVFVIEPNNGASVTTMIRLDDNDAPYAVRTTFGLVPSDYQAGLPNQKYIVLTQQGACPVQR